LGVSKSRGKSIKERKAEGRERTEPEEEKGNSAGINLKKREGLRQV